MMWETVHGDESPEIPLAFPRYQVLDAQLETYELKRPLVLRFVEASVL